MRPSTLCCCLLAVAGCRDMSSFTTGDDRYEGAVVAGSFVRAGVGPGARLCLTFDTDHVQDGPGSIWTNDGRFVAAPLRPIQQIWHDPLSTLNFGDGREKNLVYVATPSPSFAGDSGGDALAVVSLMNSGGVEVRLLRGAPGGPAGSAGSDGGAPAGGSGADNIFAVFTLDRQGGACSYTP